MNKTNGCPKCGTGEENIKQISSDKSRCIICGLIFENIKYHNGLASPKIAL